MKRSYIIYLSAVAALGGFLFGYDTAVISGTIARVADVYALDEWRQGWYVGCALVGSIGGVLGAGVLSDYLGRKPTLVISSVLFTLSALGCAFAPGFAYLVAWRVVGGVGIGIVSVVSPLYISEIAPAAYRGRLVSLYQLAITVGFLGAYLVNYQLLSAMGGDEVWRWMLGMETLPAALFFLLALSVPESRRWLEQRKVGKKEKSDWRTLLAPGVRRAVLIGSGIAILGQFMGVNAVLYYGPSIFENAGLSGNDSLFYQVLVGLINVLSTILALAIIDRIGRKRLVYYGVSGMIVSLLLIALYFMMGKAWGLSSIFMLVCFLSYIFFCAVSICTVVFVLLSEMYPTRIRGMAMSIAGFALWIGTYLIGQLTPWMLLRLTPAGTFSLFAAMCVPYILIMYRHVPETTGRTLEEIERHWERFSKTQDK
ncbi:MAG: sugar porter family MFS transporter [Mediterranea sp.]|nr:sugar porter family MFS transporter [Mediterranea sp.]